MTLCHILPERRGWVNRIIYIKNIGISKFENTLRLLFSGMKPFYYFWVKGFDIRSETIFLCWLLHLALSRAAPMTRKFVSPQRAPKVKPPRSASSFNSLTFFKFPQNAPRASGAWHHSHPPTPFPMWAIVTSLSDTSAPRAPHTCIKFAPK